MKKIAGEKGLTVKEATVTNVNDIQQAAQGLVPKGSTSSISRQITSWLRPYRFLQR